MISYIHRDISWLSFNYRVLQEAKDPNVPLFERIKFLAIYSSNLEEFFKVRVAAIRSTIQNDEKKKDQFGFYIKEALKTIRKTVNEQQIEFSRIFEKEIIPTLATHNIHLKKRYDLTKSQIKFIEEYFDNHLSPYAHPTILFKQKIRPFLMNAALYLALSLEQKTNRKKKRYAIIKIPSDYLPRFLVLPSEEGQKDVILLDEIIRHKAADLFPGYDILDSFSIKLTRDEDIDLTKFDLDDDDYSENPEVYARNNTAILQNINEQLAKRNRGPATRFVYDRNMPKEMLTYLRKIFSLQKTNLLPEGRYHNNFDFFGFPNFGMKELTDDKLPSITKKELKNFSVIHEMIKNKDVLFYFPFHSYQPIIQFFEEAANDPYVTEIKLTQYRVARKSKILEALIKAAKNGKKVTVFIELKARFDEEANLQWSKRLKEEKIEVLFGKPEIKVHSKIALITKVENDQVSKYAYLSTGNFHEKTAKIYGDYGMMTQNKALCEEIEKVFQILRTFKFEKVTFDYLLVGKVNLRERLEALIDREIANAKAKKKAEIILKMNSLEDKRMIDKLKTASQAGVKIQLIIRGICCLAPRTKNVSKNVRIISIVDRFLEHARVFWFYNDNNPKIYLSSADFMGRNLNRRVEVAFPVFDESLKTEIMDIVHLQLKDNVKARMIDGTNKNEYYQEGEEKIRSQIATYEYYKKKEA